MSIKDLVTVPVIMTCAIAGTVGILYVIKKLFPDAGAFMNNSSYSDEEKNKR